MTARRSWGAEIQNREEKFELKRRAVLKSAARIIGRSGFDTLSLADIALDLHVAKPTVYYYYRNKEEIVRELMELAVGSFLDRDSHPEDFPDKHGLDGAALLELFIRRCVRVTNAELGACLFALYPNQLSQPLRQDLDAIGLPIIELALGLIRKGIADGSIAPIDPYLAYNFMLNGLRAVPLLLEQQHSSLADLTEGVVALVVRGIKRPGAADPDSGLAD